MSSIRKTRSSERSSTSPFCPSRAGTARRGSGRLASISFLSLVLFLSCARSLSQRYPVVLDNSRDVVEEQRRGHRAISTDRRVFDFQLHYGLRGVRGEGVFLYHSPDRVRIDLYVGASELAFQYLRGPGRSRVLLPAEGRVIEGEGGTILLAGLRGLEDMAIREDELMTLMLGVYEGIRGPQGPREVRAGEEGYLMCYGDEGGETSRVHLDRHARLTGCEFLSAGRKVREIRVSGYQEVDGLSRPRSAVYRDEEKGLEIGLSFRKESINRDIDPGLFDPLPG